ncbi:CLC_0170 family protein [Paenibacillus sp. MSJ-34]|uniref:CLC_0170 family protein n=1 Tax=Paenibacillus sp. MSJ-34 TaxID=2841529 RepID=UPI00345F6531
MTSRWEAGKHDRRRSGRIRFYRFGDTVMVGDRMAHFTMGHENYEQKNMKKEKKVARFLGWFNVAAGILSFVANWMLRLWG